ncbi:Sel1 repeatcontaining protein [Acanthamoeba castellanii str. Neff]|uniref:Sel1 repeatcontaining protein n=1 Tax=Acanthamoeba castellanii (strain ATCC 30010 / Neff) TaxID=1257118 RepID=L8HAC8_ACACF|nr:Sel1 repeatcontaining protein [Acanthamoeba castellanii str. Neff]ELR22130.1 Sel1 repeatcontaining protein [Acanthamoeba castellanii str. Neff]
MDKLTSLPNIGVANAQHALGKAYLDGLFGEKSLEKALALITRAADANYAPALNSLGALYESGRHGEAKNEKQAHEYYLAAAARGETVAMLNLACLYARGALGVPQDLTKAKTWASRSVENGNWAARSIMLGMANWRNSNGVPMDAQRMELAMWFMHKVFNDMAIYYIISPTLAIL